MRSSQRRKRTDNFCRVCFSTPVAPARGNKRGRDSGAAGAVVPVRIVRMSQQEISRAVPEVRCGFCGCGKEERSSIVEGPRGANICDECVSLCANLVELEQGAN